MYELTGKLKDLSIDYRSDKCTITITVNETNELKACFEELCQCDKVSVQIDKYREKRSNAANNYMWSLCGKIAEVRSKDGIKVTKDEIYRKEIRDLNIYREDTIEPEDVGWRCRSWEEIGIGWFTERVDFTPDGEKEVIRFYYGSSRYNTKQMSKLIDNIVQDCEALGIPTKTPDQIAELLSLWETERKKNNG